MNSRFPEALTGTTTSTASPFVINGTVSFGANPNTYLPDGYKGDYFIRYVDNATVGFQSGYGVYSASADTITSLEVYQSSNGPGVAATFTSAAKIISFTVSGSELASAARVIFELPPHLDVRIGGLAQSNGAGSYYVNPANAIQTIDDNVWHYATNGQAEVGRPKSWRVLDPNTEVLALDEWDTLPVNVICTAGRRKLDGATYKFTTSPCYSFARNVAKFMGRRVRLVTGALGGVNFDDGFSYPAGSVSLKFVEAVTAALAALPAEQKLGGVEKLHILMWNQGESDMTGGSASGMEYAYKLAALFKIFKNTLAGDWNICDDNTLFLICGVHEYLRKVSGVNLKFNGFRQACDLIGTQATYIHIPDGVPLKADNLHYTAEACDIIGKGAFQTVFTTGANSKHVDSTWTYKEQAYSLGAISDYSLQAAGAGAVTAGQMRFASDDSSVRIAKISRGLGFFPETLWDFGMKNWTVGDQFTIENTEQIPIVNGLRVTLLSAPTESTDYATWNCSVEPIGTRPASGTNVVMNCNLPLVDRTKAKLAAELPIELASWADGKETAIATLEATQQKLRMPFMDRNGALHRSHVQAPIYVKGNTTSNETVSLAPMLWGYPCMMYLDLEIAYKTTGAFNSVGLFTLKGIVAVTGISATGVLRYAPAATALINEQSVTPVPVLVTNLSGTIGGWKINVTGKLSVPLDWIITGTMAVLN